MPRWVVVCKSEQCDGDSKTATYDPTDYAVICDECGSKYYGDDTTAYDLDEVEGFRREYEAAKNQGLADSDDTEEDTRERDIDFLRDDYEAHR